MLRLIRSVLLISLTLASNVVVGKSKEPPQQETTQSSGSPSSLATFVPHLPSDSAKFNISIPSGGKLKYLAIGSGSQNYKCGPTSPQDKTLMWLYQGAVAEMRDASKDPANALKIVNDMMHGRKGGRQPSANTNNLPLLGKHFFVTTKGAAGPPAPSPKFDFSTGLHLKGDAAFLIAKKVGSMPSPLKSQHNINWLQLQTVQGSLATTVLRTNTRGGMPPSGACQSGQTIQVRYAAVYQFY